MSLANWRFYLSYFKRRVAHWRQNRLIAEQQKRKSSVRPIAEQ